MVDEDPDAHETSGSAPPDEQRSYLNAEVKRVVETAATFTARAASQTRLWNALHIVLGGGAAVLAVVAGYAGLASDEGRVPSAILALAAAAFAAANTFLNCEARREWNQQRKSAWRGIELDARLILGCEAYQSNDLFYHALRQIAQQQKAAYAGDFTRALGVASFRSLPTDNGDARSPSEGA